jgi:hypothetical protein
MFCSNIVRGMQLKHTWSLAFYGGRFLNFKIYLWTSNSSELVKCGIYIKELEIKTTNQTIYTQSKLETYNFYFYINIKLFVICNKSLQNFK